MNSYCTIHAEYIECTLCPHFCRLKPGQTGICRVRKNINNKIELLTYGVISALNVDPVEKKPLYHYYPGYNVLSVGSYGCNLRCDFCQNYHISQEVPFNKSFSADTEKIISSVLGAERNIGIAFTYNEPIIWFEFMRDIAMAIKDAGLHTIMVSNGFVNPEPMKEILQFIDAFNIDLKGFTNSFYRKLTGADINPVLQNLKKISQSGKHLELTTLIIPGQNDNERQMELQSEWIAGELGKSTPLHISRYFPMHKRNDPPTPVEVIEKLVDITAKNLDYVYSGNVSSTRGKDTICPQCGSLLTKRSAYLTRLMNLDSEGRCKKCNKLIYKEMPIYP